MFIHLFIFQIFATCSTFYVPLLVILFLYWKIYQTARKRIHRRRPRQLLRPITQVFLFLKTFGFSLNNRTKTKRDNFSRLYHQFKKNGRFRCASYQKSIKNHKYQLWVSSRAIQQLLRTAARTDADLMLIQFLIVIQQLQQRWLGFKHIRIIIDVFNK